MTRKKHILFLNYITLFLLFLALHIRLEAQDNFSGTIEYNFTNALAPPKREHLSLEIQQKIDSMEVTLEARLKAKGIRIITSKNPLITKYLIVFDNFKTWAYWYNNDVLTNPCTCHQNINNKIITSKENTLTAKYLVLDTMSVIPWKLLNKSKKIQNIECFSAIAEYRGRVWTAWYAPSIPISSGPWKLYGLPGMILEAEDKDGLMRFECSKLQIPKPKNLELNIVTPFLNDKDENITYKDYIKKLKKSIDNYEKMQTDKNGFGGGKSIAGIEIFDFEENIKTKRIQQKLSDIPKK